MRLIQSLKPVYPTNSVVYTIAARPQLVWSSPHFQLAAQPGQGYEWTIDNITSNGLLVDFFSSDTPSFTSAVLHIFLNQYLVTDIPMLPYNVNVPGASHVAASFRGSDNMNSALSMLPNDQLSAALDVIFTTATGAQTNQDVTLGSDGNWQLMAFGSTDTIGH